MTTNESAMIPSNPHSEQDFHDELRALYADLDAAVAALGPVCVLSGRCCRFTEFGHTLFLSGPEAEVLLSQSPPPARPLDHGASCPWQDLNGHCTARSARPLGCRVYYCDPAYEPHAAELSETFITRLKRLTESSGLSWSYAPLHEHLRRAVERGALAPPQSDDPPEINPAPPA